MDIQGSDFALRKILELSPVNIGSKINSPNTYEKQLGLVALASQPFQGFKSPLFFKSDNLFLHRF